MSHNAKSGQCTRCRQFIKEPLNFPEADERLRLFRLVPALRAALEAQT